MDRWIPRVLLAVCLLLSLAPEAACSKPMATPVAPQTVALPSPPSATPAAAGAPMTFAVIGDYGTDDVHERDVARLVASWAPSFIITTGDDYYTVAGGTGGARYDESTGAYYGNWLKDIRTTGHRLPHGLSAVYAFFPSLGNHDYSDARPAPTTYLSYFTLPGSGVPNSSGNERYYDFVRGSVHFFVLNSNRQEPDGTSSISKQARWLKRALAASTSTWNVVYDHHAPYSSDKTHGSITYMRWPYAAWGADVVISGHAHVYERIHRNGLVYFVNGLGGAKRYPFSHAIGGSRVRFNTTWGAQRVVATDSYIEFEFVSIAGVVVDRYRRLAATP